MFYKEYGMEFANFSYFELALLGVAVIWLVRYLWGYIFLLKLERKIYNATLRMMRLYEVIRCTVVKDTTLPDVTTYLQSLGVAVEGRIVKRVEARCRLFRLLEKRTKEMIDLAFAGEEGGQGDDRDIGDDVVEVERP